MLFTARDFDGGAFAVADDGALDGGFGGIFADAEPLVTVAAEEGLLAIGAGGAACQGDESQTGEKDVWRVGAKPEGGEKTFQTGPISERPKPPAKPHDSNDTQGGVSGVLLRHGGFDGGLDGGIDAGNGAGKDLRMQGGDSESKDSESEEE